MEEKEPFEKSSMNKFWMWLTKEIKLLEKRMHRKRPKQRIKIVDKLSELRNKTYSDNDKIGVND